MDRYKIVLDKIRELPKEQMLRLHNTLVAKAGREEAHRKIRHLDEESVNEFFRYSTPWDILGSIDPEVFHINDKYFATDEYCDTILTFNDLYSEWSAEEQFAIDCLEKAFAWIEKEEDLWGRSYVKTFEKFGIDLKAIAKAYPEDEEEEENEGEDEY